MLKSFKIQPSKNEIYIILSGILTFIATILLLERYQISILQSDPYMYLLQSRSWWLKDLHLPGYAMLLWCFNLLTIGVLSDIQLLHLFAAICWLASLLTFIAITLHLNLEQRIKEVLLILYAYFPLIGVTFAAWPIADSAVWLLINLLVLACLKKDWVLFTFALAIGLLLHKVVWAFCALVSLYALVSLGFSFWRILIGALPLVAFWAWIVLQGNSPLWVIQHDLERHFPSYSELPIFDGILGTILLGTPRDMAKGVLLLVIYLFEIFFFFKAVKNKNFLVLAILFPLLLLGATVNQWLAVAVLRFGKISVLAAALLLASNHIKFPNFLKSPKLIIAIACILIGSQFFYVSNIKSYFESGGILDQKLQIEKSVMESKGLPTYEK